MPLSPLPDWNGTGSVLLQETALFYFFAIEKLPVAAKSAAGVDKTDRRMVIPSEPPR